MNVQNVFARYETKFVISKAQRERIEAAMDGKMRGDEFGKSEICTVYYDTPDYLLIRRSIESPVYKEKLRLRSYGVAESGDTVYAEIKKKYDSVVYKRRVGMEFRKAEAYLNLGIIGRGAANEQISGELDYMLRRYGHLIPTAFVSCEREAFFAENDREFRVTFDTNIYGRDWDLSLGAGIYGIPLLGSGEVLMEVKTPGAIPLWFCRILSSERINTTSFSKYGAVYKDLIIMKNKYNYINEVDINVTKSVQWIV